MAQAVPTSCGWWPGERNQSCHYRPLHTLQHEEVTNCRLWCSFLPKQSLTDGEQISGWSFRNNMLTIWKRESLCARPLLVNCRLWAFQRCSASGCVGGMNWHDYRVQTSHCFQFIVSFSFEEEETWPSLFYCFLHNAKNILRKYNVDIIKPCPVWPCQRLKSIFRKTIFSICAHSA